jgi:hypothetical protein
MGERRGAYRIPAGRPERRRPLARSRHRWMDNIKKEKWYGARSGSL